MGELLMGGDKGALFACPVPTSTKQEDERRQLELIYELCGTPAPATYGTWPPSLRELLPLSHRSNAKSKLHDNVHLKSRSARPGLCSPSAVTAMAAMLTLNPLERTPAKSVLCLPYFALDAPTPYTPEQMMRLTSSAYGRKPSH